MTPQPASTPSSSGILDGVRVLAFTIAYAGPYGGRLLAQHGADVIKVESRSSVDTFRYFGKDLNSSARFIECNLGVRSLALNLKHPRGVALVKELAAHSDAVLENFRPGVLARLGLGDDELRKINPGMIVLRLPGLGEWGPKSGYGTWGFNLTAYSGMTYLWNHPDQPRPVGSQGVYPDHVAFILAPSLLVAALLHRRRTGKGVSIDVAQAEATAYMLGVSYLETSVNGEHPEPRGNRGRNDAPHGCYRCKGEDRWCVIAVESDEQWRSLCRILGETSLAADSRYADSASRLRHAAELDALVGRWTAERTPEEVMTRLQAEGVAAGVVQNGDDLMRDPQLRHRGYYEAYPDSPVGPMEVPRSALRFSGMTDDPIPPAPGLGEHTVPILRDLLGYSESDIAEMEKEGILA